MNTGLSNLVTDVTYTEHKWLHNLSCVAAILMMMQGIIPHIIELVLQSAQLTIMRGIIPHIIELMLQSAQRVALCLQSNLHHAKLNALQEHLVAQTLHVFLPGLQPVLQLAQDHWQKHIGKSGMHLDPADYRCCCVLRRALSSYISLEHRGYNDVLKNMLPCTLCVQEKTCFPARCVVKNFA